MAGKTTPKDVQKAIYRAMRSLPLVGDLFEEEQDELLKRSKRLELEKGQYKNALAESMRALNQTISSLEEIVSELDRARQEIRRMLAPPANETLREDSLNAGAAGN